MCSVVLRFLVLMMVATAVLQSPVTQASSARRSLPSLGLGDVSCGCGSSSRNMTRLVVKSTKVSDCTNVPYRGPRGLPSANEKGYPLKVRVRRSMDNSRMFINWNLKYIPKKKRAKVTDFYLHFTKPQKKSKTRRDQRGACFVVLPNGSEKCQRKVSCVANFKRRPRRVSVNLLYRFAAKKSKNGGRRKRRGGQKYFRLKASARRKGKRSIKGYQGPQTTEITSCDEWSPSIKTECAGEGKLLVEFSPENPLATEIEVGLHEGISPRQMDTKKIKGNASCTFENLKSGNYSVTLRPRSPDCYGVLPFRSGIIHVNGETRAVGLGGSSFNTSCTVGNTTTTIPATTTTTPPSLTDPTGCTLESMTTRSTEKTPNGNGTTLPPTTPPPIPPTTPPPIPPTTPPPIPPTPPPPYALLAMLVCSVLIVVVAALVVVWICKRSGKERHGSENDPEAISLDELPDTDAPPWTREDDINSGPGADHHPDEAPTPVDDDTFVKVPLISKHIARTTLETINETQPHVPNAAGNFAARYDITHQTERKCQVKIVFLVHIREADNGLQDILGHFADVMRSLSSCSIDVKLDFKCGNDNQKDVKGWAEEILSSCANVVVVLSESLVTVCQSYQRSMSLAANSTSADTDIAPFVMRELSDGRCSGLAVFVHFGMHKAEQQFESLLGLFSSPTSLSGSNGSDGFENGEVTSSPPVRGPSDTVNISTYSAVALSIDVVADAGEAPSYHSGGWNSCPDQQARCLSHHDAGHGKPSQTDVMRERHKSEPPKTNCRCLHPPAYPACPTLPVSSSSLSYPTACPHLSSAVHSSVCNDAPGASPLGPPPPYTRYSESVAPGPSLRHQHVPHSIPVDTFKPHRQGSHAWTNGNKPQLLSLRGAKGLKEFLRILSQDERAIDSAVASEDAKSLFDCIERRYGDRIPRGEPVEHTWTASPTQSTTSVCEKHSLQNLASADVDS